MTPFGDSNSASAISANDSSSCLYIVIYSGRCGSTLLMDLLYQTGVAGRYPKEISEPFNKHAVCELPGCDLASVDVDHYISYLHKKYQSPNGCFGFKVSWEQIEQRIIKGDFDNVLKKSKIIFLKRLDIISQGVSFYIANKTNYWHSFVPIEQVRMESFRVTYDSWSIVNEIIDIHEREKRFIEYLKRLGCEFIPLNYEDLVSSTRTLLNEVLNYTCIDDYVGCDIKPTMTPVFTETNAAFVDMLKHDKTAIAMLHAKGIDCDRIKTLSSES